jgi:hypothetical protein
VLLLYSSADTEENIKHSVRIGDNPIDDFLLKIFEAVLEKQARFVYLLILLHFPEFVTSDKTIAEGFARLGVH